MLNSNTIPDATLEEHALYRKQAEEKILPRVGFKNADEVRRALKNNNCHIAK